MNEGIRVVQLRGLGDVFVAEQVNDGKRQFYRNPMSLVPVRDPQTGETRISLQPWFAMAEFDRKEGIEISASDVMFNMAAIADLKNAYNMTVNPVQQASSLMLPENMNGIDPSEMTGDGLRLVRE